MRRHAPALNRHEPHLLAEAESGDVAVLKYDESQMHCRINSQPENPECTSGITEIERNAEARHRQCSMHSIGTGRNTTEKCNEFEMSKSPNEHAQRMYEQQCHITNVMPHTSTSYASARKQPAALLRHAALEHARICYGISEPAAARKNGTGRVKPNRALNAFVCSSRRSHVASHGDLPPAQI